MRNRFDRQLSTLNDELIEMGSMIENLLKRQSRHWSIRMWI